MAVVKKKIFRNKTNITQIVYAEDMTKIEIVPGATVEGDENHYLVKFGGVLEEVRVDAKAETKAK